MDIISANSISNWADVFTNDSRGRFAFACRAVVGNRPISVVSADFDNDGWLDLALASNPAGTVNVLFNTPVLSVRRIANSVSVTWLSAWTNYFLQQNETLFTTNWATLTGVTDDGTNRSVSLTPAKENLFFRLTGK